jgi:hypothetical protein
LGALDCVREHEGVYHGDYDTRHIIFSPARDVSLAVIDVEGSRTESRSDIDTESQKMMDDFNRITSSQRDKDVLRTWYEQGRNMLSLSSTKYLPLILQRINQEYRVDFDMAAMSLNGFSLRDRGST